MLIASRTIAEHGKNIFRPRNPVANLLFLNYPF